MSRTFLQPIVKGANFDSFVGVEKAGLSEPAPTNAPVVDETVLAVLG
jgi:hypothetical protein